MVWDTTGGGGRRGGVTLGLTEGTAIPDIPFSVPEGPARWRPKGGALAAGREVSGSPGVGRTSLAAEQQRGGGACGEHPGGGRARHLRESEPTRQREP